MLFFRNIWTRLNLMLICVAIMSLSGPFQVASAATIPAPRVKPVAPNSSQILSKSDAKAFRLAMRAADRRSWSEVIRYERQITDPTAKRILLWRRAADNSGTDINDLTRAKDSLVGWPRMTVILSRGEKLIFDRPLPARETLDWFTGREPVSGEGRAALARAHYKLGNSQSGDEWLRLAWREAKLTRDRQRTLFKEYKSRLTPDDNAARADYLIWLGASHYSSAEALLPHMRKADRALMNARIRVGGNRSGMDAAIKALTPQQAKDTGILFERARWRRKRKTKDYALPVYQEIRAPATTEPGKHRLWIEKKIMSYWLLEDKRYTDAYNMTLHHGLERGEGFADAEFLAGWIALVYMNDAPRALRHFTTLKNGVSMPVSSARASYWQGRASEAMGTSLASTYYAEGAQFVNTYYGQLSAEQVSPGFAYVSLPPEGTGAALKMEFESRDIIRALRIIGEIGNERVFRQVSFHLDDVLTDPRELTLLASVARDYNFMAPSVRAAKQSGRLNAILTDSGYPTPAIITDLGSDFDLPFVLSIARQESEFNTIAVSSAKAYGMMQMINSTAKATARKHKLSYQRSWLTSDQEYAAKLGAHHLHDLLERFDGSYIMSAAAYNAGTSRVLKWNKLYGDPRKGEIDPVDWVENIPFSETRNYVQRVMENLQVYRARLANDQAQLTLEDDLSRGQIR